MNDLKKGSYVYSLYLQIHYCDEENEDKSHHLHNYNIGRKTFDECLTIIKSLGIKKYRFTSRPKKPNYFQSKYGNYDLGCVDVCILYVYVGENGKAK